MSRSIVVPVLIALVAAAAAHADVVVTKDGKLYGIKSEINDVKITADNVEAYLDQSDGEIVREGYDSIAIKKRARDRKAVVIPWSSVAKRLFSNEPEALLDGLDQMAVGAYPQAIGAFQEVVGNAELSPVYRHWANFNIGICYYRAGNVKNAVQHWSGWKGGNSIYTPEVYRILAEIHTTQNKFGAARSMYGKIAGLPDITPTWTYKARLGEVRVDIAERKFQEAEETAKRIASEASRDPKLNSARALAHALQARAIVDAVIGTENKDRLVEAQRLLDTATKLSDVEGGIQALVYSTLGDAIYAQGRPEEARFSYMRVVLMHPDDANVPHALNNAGTCFLDMSGRADAKGEQAKSDEYLVAGMKLLAECAGRHRGSEAARNAAKKYRENKKRYEKLKATEEGEEKEG